VFTVTGGWLDWHEPGWQKEGGAQKALDHYGQSVKYQNNALAVAEEHGLEFQVADTCDDLAQVYGDQSVLLTRLGRMEKAKESRGEAESYLDRVMKMVPSAFQLVPGVGFREAPEPGEAYWSSLGKVHLWRSIWAFRDLEMGRVPDQEREEWLKGASQQLILAVAYFQRYWPASYALERTLGYFSGFLQTAGVSARWAHRQVRGMASEYHLNLDVLEDVIDDVLGPFEASE